MCIVVVHSMLGEVGQGSLMGGYLDEINEERLT